MRKFEELKPRERELTQRELEILFGNIDPSKIGDVFKIPKLEVPRFPYAIEWEQGDTRTARIMSQYDWVIDANGTWHAQRPEKETMPKKTEPAPVAPEKVLAAIMQPRPGVTRFVGTADFDKQKELAEQADADEDRIPRFSDHYKTMQSEHYLPVPLQIWQPNMKPNEDYNLILSLATDGYHYPVFDLDLWEYPADLQQRGDKLRGEHIENGSRQIVELPRAKTGFNGVFKSKSGRCHYYCSVPMTFDQYIQALTAIPGEDAKRYMVMQRERGFGGLRPPIFD